MLTILPTQRTVILHADDFGMNTAVNAGIVRAFREGCLTSTSLLVNAPEAESAVALWRQLQQGMKSGDVLPRNHSLAESNHGFDLGLHFNLTQGFPLTKDFPARLRDSHGAFLSISRLYRRLVGSGSRYVAAVRDELFAQINWLRDRGVVPTHVNGHQYVELVPNVTTALIDVLPRVRIQRVRFPREQWLTSTTLKQGRAVEWCLALLKRWHAIPYMNRMTRQGFRGVSHYCGTAHAGRVDLRRLREWIDRVPLGEAIEIGLHPAEEASAPTCPGWDDPLAAYRPRELAMLVSEELASYLASADCRLGRITESAVAPESVACAPRFGTARQA